VSRDRTGGIESGGTKCFWHWGRKDETVARGVADGSDVMRLEALSVLLLLLGLSGCDCVPGRVRTVTLSASQRARLGPDGTTSSAACREVCAEFEVFLFDADLPRDAFSSDGGASGDAGVRQANVTQCEVAGMQLTCRYAGSCR
jgi:hypothetical protein